MYEEALSDKVKEIQNSRISMIAQFVEEAKHVGEFREDLDSNNVALMISALKRLLKALETERRVIA